ncbi:putative nonribosomal peptide synthase protein [Botrytis fragariae]|uniref:Putative nonribosomal peptide synthase protein n=1 Tax=Botrytis fragariae TaxID=1964551 RepID=A0A8H6EF75_9HELO|nr:putative nonribosomal peptide synthase protein [Botrytis fragariae]KAF5870149.1 putative nonribosomal peptide synthase protein [Botrytis fragariae]
MLQDGDLVKYNEDGSLDFVGRKDLQVKINGQRIELEDIELQIAKKCSEQWTAAVEAFRPAGSLAQQMIVAFFWPTKSSLNSQASPTPLLEMTDEMTDEMQLETLRLKNDLAQLLPAYMIPSAYAPLNCMPTTTTGKLNRKALRRLGESISNTQMIQYTLGLSSSEKGQPRNDKETTFQKLWSSILKISSELIGIEDDFFQLGGESVAAIKLAAAARRINLQLTVADIFRRPVLSDMALSTEILKQDHKLLPAMHRGSQLTAHLYLATEGYARSNQKEM